MMTLNRNAPLLLLNGRNAIPRNDLLAVRACTHRHAYLNKWETKKNVELMILNGLKNILT